MTEGATDRTNSYRAVIFTSQVNALRGPGTMLFFYKALVLQPMITTFTYGLFTDENIIAGCQDLITDEQ